MIAAVAVRSYLTAALESQWENGSRPDTGATQFWYTAPVFLEVSRFSRRSHM